MRTLALTGEIVLPAKRAQAPQLLQSRVLQRRPFLYAAYITPAASFVVLIRGKEGAGRDHTAGCVLYPVGPDHVSSICDSGRCSR